MAETITSGSAGDGSSQDITINHAVIDNSGYSYYLWLLTLDIYLIYLFNAVIEYEYEVPGNLEDFTESQQTQVSQDLITR